MSAITGYFPPGPYTATYASDSGNSAASVGLMEGPIRHQQNVAALPVRCSLYGQNIIDYVLQGGGVFAVLTLKEWFPGARAVMWPFYSNSNAWDQQGVFPLTGTLFSTFCKPLVLTAVAGTPAAGISTTTNQGPLTRTYPLCALLPGHNLDITFGPMERNVPIVLAVLPQVFNPGNGAVPGQPVYYTDTYAA